MKYSSKPHSLFSQYIFFTVGAWVTAFILSMAISYFCIAREIDIETSVDERVYGALLENYRILRSFLELGDSPTTSGSSALASAATDDPGSIAGKLIEAENRLAAKQSDAAGELLNTISPSVHPFFQDWRKEIRLRMLWEIGNYQGFVDLFANPFQDRQLDVFLVEALRQMNQPAESFRRFHALFRRYPLTTFQGIIPEPILRSYCKRLHPAAWVERLQGLLAANNPTEFDRQISYASISPDTLLMLMADKFYRLKEYSASRKRAEKVKHPEHRPRAEAILFKIDYRQGSVPDLIPASKRFADTGREYVRLCWDLANITLTESRFADALYFFREYMRSESAATDDYWKAIWISAWLEYRLGNLEGARGMFDRGARSPVFGYRVACQYWLSRLNGNPQPEIDKFPVSYYAMKVFGDSLFSGQALMGFKDRLNHSVSPGLQDTFRFIQGLWNAGLPDVVERFFLWHGRNREAQPVDREMTAMVQSILLYHRGEFRRSHAYFKKQSTIVSQAILPPLLQRVFYPIAHQETIARYSRESAIDPLLIAAIIREESFFQANAVSSANALGMMQLLLRTAQDVAKGMGLSVTRDDLFKPDFNIQLGVKYFKSLLDKYEGKTYLALAAYNAGDHRVDRWLQEYSGYSEEEFIEMIPFSETRNYVKNILLSYFVYLYYHETV